VKWRRTLLTAGVFALMAMIYVPSPRERGVHSAGYRFVFSQGDTSIAFFQLLVNVVFAALLGAILATVVARMSKRALYATAGCVVIVALGVGVFAFTGAAANRARSDEEYADQLLSLHYSDEAAKFSLRIAAYNWRLAFRFDDAVRVKNRIRELQQHPAPDWRNDPIVDLSGLPDQAPPAQTPQDSGQRAPILRALPVRSPSP
jgi:hypothetical protein